MPEHKCLSIRQLCYTNPPNFFCAGLGFNKWGNIVVDDNCKTSMEGVYVGGDIVLGAATVILAMGQGRIAAAAMNDYLAEKKKSRDLAQS